MLKFENIGENSMKKMNMVFGIILALIILTNNFTIGCYAVTSKGTAPKNQYQTYMNKRFRFTLQFPLGWKGYYIIDESDRDCIVISFIGKSNVSKYGDLENPDIITGLTMFYIGNDESIKDGFIDGVKKIGTSHKINYYYFTDTDYPVGGLNDFYNDSENTDIEEKKLAHDDFLKAKQMMKDVDQISKSFKAN